MHTGEDFFVWAWPQYLLIGAVFLCYLLLAFRNKLPGMQAFKDFLDAVNSSGGHIFILMLLTVWSIRIAMQFFYHLMSIPPEQVDKNSAIITAGITFVQGTLAGTFIGALLKTMSGGKANGANGTLPVPPLPTGATPISPVPAPESTAPVVAASTTSKTFVGTPPAGAAIGFVGDRGITGDLGTNNLSRK